MQIQCAYCGQDAEQKQMKGPHLFLEFVRFVTLVARSLR